MEETNEVSQSLKQAIYDYYMGYIREKHTFLEEGQEEKISAAIMQLVERKIELNQKATTKKEEVKREEEIELPALKEENQELTIDDFIDDFKL